MSTHVVLPWTHSQLQWGLHRQWQTWWEGVRGTAQQAAHVTSLCDVAVPDATHLPLVQSHLFRSASLQAVSAAFRRDRKHSSLPQVYAV